MGENLLGNEGILVIREPLMVNGSVLQLGLAQTNVTCEGTTAVHVVQMFETSGSRVSLQKFSFFFFSENSKKFSLLLWKMENNVQI